MVSFQYTITDEAGLHARPAGILVKEAKKYESTVMIKKDGKAVEATKLLGLMGLGIKNGQTVDVEITGADEKVAYEELKKFFEENL